jgi:hypothetical protein
MNIKIPRSGNKLKTPTSPNEKMLKQYVEKSRNFQIHSKSTNKEKGGKS